MGRLFGVRSCPELSNLELNFRNNVFHQNRSYGDFLSNSGFMTRKLYDFMFTLHLSRDCDV